MLTPTMADTDVTQVTPLETEGVKCGPMGADIPMPAPVGGATSFAEVDAYELAREVDDGVYALRRHFEDIVSNIWGDDAMTVADKQAAIIKASRDLADRMAEVADEEMGEGERGLVGGIKSLLTRAKAVWTGAYINNLPDSAFAFIESGGKKDDDSKTTPRNLRHFPHHNAKGEVDLPHLRNAMSRMMQSPHGDDAKPHLDAHAKKMGVGMMGEEKDVGATSFIVTKDLEGSYRWLALSSNNFEDREGETFSEEAHREYIDWVDRSKDYPELRLWHVPGTAIGHADFAAYADHFMLHSGTFDPEFQHLAPALAAKQYGVSHGFHYAESDKQGGVFSRYRTFEVSILPPERAANSWTSFASIQAIKEVVMTLPADKKQFLVDHIGPERTDVVESALATVGKELVGLGISFKDLDDAAPAAADPPAAQAPADPPADPDPKPDPAPDGEGDGDGDGDAAAPSDELKELIAGVKALASLPTDIAGLKEQLTAMGTRVEALERSDDAKLDDRMAPQRAAVVTNRPSNSDGNVIDDDKADTMIGDKAVDAPVNPILPYVTDLFGAGKKEDQQAAAV